MTPALQAARKALAGRPFDLVALCGSAGSLDVLLRLVPRLQPAARFAVAIVVHLGPESPGLLPQLLADACHLPAGEVESGEPIRSGRLYVAPPGYHLSVERDLTFSLSCEDPVQFSRPSIDVFLASVADAFADRALACLLTGANEDGARGLALVAQRGGAVVVEDPETASWPQMPQAGLSHVPGATRLSADELAALLRDLSSADAPGAEGSPSLPGSEKR